MSFTSLGQATNGQIPPLEKVGLWLLVARFRRWKRLVYGYLWPDSATGIYGHINGETLPIEGSVYSLIWPLKKLPHA